MKNKILTIVAGGCLMLGGLTSCEDFLTIYPTSSITEEQFWEDKNDLENAMMACYYQMTTTSYLNRLLYWGEARSDNATLKYVSSSSLMNYTNGVLEYTEDMFSWAAFYTAINYCNKIIEYAPIVAERDPSLSSGEETQYIVEAKALRALHYFYLVRAFRDVPLVLQSISTDAEARDEETSQLPQTAGLQVLDSLIADLDTLKDSGAVSYSSSSETCGRMTRNGVYALLADMYLWRACLLNNAEDKGYTFNPSSASNTDSTAAEQCVSDLNKVVEYCTYVIDDMKETYEENNRNTTSQTEQESRYPLIRISNLYTKTDEIFEEIFVSQNSSESIFEVQFDGTNNINSTWTGLMTSVSSSTLTGQYFTINSRMYSSISSVDPTVGFGKGDLRALENTDISTSSSQYEYVYTKFTRSGLSVNYMSDMSDGASQASYRANASNAANFLVYRLSDVMLMKAEALARLGSTGTDLQEGFWLTNAIYQRSNPRVSADGSIAADDGGTAMTSDRFSDSYYSSYDADDLLSLVYYERQREFLGEYKRWFDLVRYAEWENSTENILTMMNATRTLQTRLKTLNSLYNPVYEDELKVNPNLVQNPAWD